MNIHRQAMKFGIVNCLLVLLLLAGIAMRLTAQNYAIDWFTVDGGGGTSSGGAYTLSGTIGQPDAGGPMTAANYSLTGGFWSLLTVIQTPGAPMLNIRLTSTNTTVVSWSSPSAGFILQQNTSLATPSWTTPLELVNDDGTNRFIIVSPPAGDRFYRLAHP